MKQAASNKYILVALALVIVVAVGWWWIADSHTSKNSYEGQKAVLITPNRTVSLQIYTAVRRLSPKVSAGTQVNTHIAAFTTSAAEGDVTFSNSHAPIQFMVAKSKSKWVIIAHNTGKTLLLPNTTTAKKYNLPENWYTVN